MVSFVGLGLMIASNVAAWKMVSRTSSSTDSLRSAVWKISLFYALWALFNRYVLGRTGELGYVSFGLLAINCKLAHDYLPPLLTLGSNSISNPAQKLEIASCILVVLNFAASIPMIVAAGGPVGFAHRVWEDASPSSKLAALWGYTFAAYAGSNIALWSYCGYLFFRLDDDDFGYSNNSATSYTVPTIQQSDYQPVQMADV